MHIYMYVIIDVIKVSFGISHDLPFNVLFTAYAEKL